MTWVLLRGLARETGHWGDFSALLRARLPDTPVVPIDLPGNGEAHRQRSPADVPSIVQALRDSLRQRGLPPPYRVVAMSLGAMVTVAWAHRHPDELAHAVLINTSLRPFSPFHHRLRPSAWGPLLTAALSSDPLRREQAVWRLTSHRPPQHRDAIVAGWARLAHERPVRLSNALRQLAAAARYRAPEVPPRVQMLLLCSARDALVNPACSRAVARGWQLAIAAHPWAGHDLPLDDPAWVVAQVLDWLP
jgi:pimeloyl-ACP methyl ester carboxylesterase